MSDKNDKIIKKIKRLNRVSLLKGIFGKIFKESLVLEIGTKKEKVEIILPEKIASDPAKKQIYLKKHGIDFTNIRKLHLGSNYYRNIYEFIFKKNLSDKDIAHILKTIGNIYYLGINNIKETFLNVSDTLKNELANDIVGTLKQYNFPHKDEIIGKLRTLNGRTTKEKGEGYMNIANEIEEQIKVKKHIRKEMVMPFISFMLTIGIFVVANTSLFPVFLESFGQGNEDLTNIITGNFVYIIYHFVINNYIALIVLGIALLVAIFVLKQIAIVRFYFTKILLYLPGIGNVIKYKELLNLTNNLINKFRYNIQNEELYSNLKNTSSEYYQKYYTTNNIFDIEKMIKKMVKEGALPIEEGSFLVSLTSGQQGYLNIQNIVKLNKQIIIKYQEAIDKYLGYIKSFFFIVTAILVFYVVKALYLSMYEMMGSI